MSLAFLDSAYDGGGQGQIERGREVSFRDGASATILGEGTRPSSARAPAPPRAAPGGRWAAGGDPLADHAGRDADHRHVERCRSGRGPRVWASSSRSACGDVAPAPPRPGARAARIALGLAPGRGSSASWSAPRMNQSRCRARRPPSPRGCRPCSWGRRGSSSMRRDDQARAVGDGALQPVGAPLGRRHGRVVLVGRAARPAPGAPRRGRAASRASRATIRWPMCGGSKVPAQHPDAAGARG